jgi:hypothetical protein
VLAEVKWTNTLAYFSRSIGEAENKKFDNVDNSKNEFLMMMVRQSELFRHFALLQR